MVRTSLFVLALFCFAFVGGAQAQTAPNLTGVWKWTTEMNGNTREQTLNLKLEGETVTGFMMGRDGEPIVIEEGTFKDGVVAFKITRERNGQTFVMNYSAKLNGDTLEGKTTFTFNGETRDRDWVAKRS